MLPCGNEIFAKESVFMIRTDWKKGIKKKTVKTAKVGNKNKYGVYFL